MDKAALDIFQSNLSHAGLDRMSSSRRSGGVIVHHQRVVLRDNAAKVFNHHQEEHTFITPPLTFEAPINRF